MKEGEETAEKGEGGEETAEKDEGGGRDNREGEACDFSAHIKQTHDWDESSKFKSSLEEQWLLFVFSKQVLHSYENIIQKGKQ